jgi:peptide/nickel transport system substrate-binding protein
MIRTQNSEFRIQNFCHPIAFLLFSLLFCLFGCSGARRTPAVQGGGAKILNYTIANDISNMDPAQIHDVESAIVATQVYQGLVKFKPDSVEVEPDLAESYDVTTDGLRWTFRLRKGVRFHDGTPFDAEAVRFSVTRQMDAHHPFHVAGKMRYANLMFGDRSSTETELVRDVSAPDEHTVVFTLARRYMPFAKNLAMTPAAIVSPLAARIAGGDFNTTMSGTGPFRLKSYRADQSAVVERNPDYWGARPPLDEIRFRIMRDANIRLNSIRKGQSDVIAGVEPLAVEMLRKDRNITVSSEPSMNLGFLSLNNAAPPFDNVLVRLAVNHAIDRGYISETLFSGTSVAATGVIPPGMSGYDPRRPGFPHDPAKAKDLLAKAGYPNGFTVKFLTHDRPRVYNPVGSKLAERIQQDLAVVGITATIEQVEFPYFLARMKSREFQMANSGWVTDNGDPDNFIYELFGREDNEQNYVNPEATRLMRDATGEPDEARRAEMYRQAEAMLAENPPAVPLNNAKQVLAVRARVKHLHLHPTAVTQLHLVDVESE